MRSAPRAPTRSSVFRCSDRDWLRAILRATLTGRRGPIMMAPQSISVYLNNALKPTPEMVELDGETSLPDVIRDMPDEVTGHFLALDPTAAHDIEAAWKRVMILNATQVLYTFTYDPATVTFSARKR